MDNYRTEIWSQWDKQEANRIAELASDCAFTEMNNLYLSIERGDVRLNRSLYNHLYILNCRTFEKTDRMFDWWMGEFEKLPNWGNF